MSAYKKLNKEDSYLTSYTAHKSFVVTGSDHTAFGIETYIGISGSSTFHPTASIKRLAGTDFEHYEDLVYRSIKHLYYSGFENAEPISYSYDISGSSVENYLQSSYRSQQRRAEDRFTVISIPKNLIGTHIKPGSVIIKPDNTELSGSYVSGSYVVDDYEEDGLDPYGSTPSHLNFNAPSASNYINAYKNYTDVEFVSASDDEPWRTEIIDDGNGNLVLSGSRNYRTVIGNVIYPHGLLIFTNPTVANYYGNYFSGSVEWKASHPIYTYNYHCRIKESEFNFTQNPSAVKNDTTGSIADNLTGSEFQPYFTTVGLYNDTNELIAVAKMAQPIPVSDNTEATVVIKLDM